MGGEGSADPPLEVMVDVLGGAGPPPPDDGVPLFAPPPVRAMCACSMSTGDGELMVFRF